MDMKYLFSFFVLVLAVSSVTAQTNHKPVKVGVVGLTHTHVHWILGRENPGDITIVGIVEPNRELAKRYSLQHGYSMDIVFDTMEEMIDAVEPEAITAFGSIYEHLEVVEIAAPLGIHVMVEKPLAVSMEHAVRMKELAEQHDILLLTNYETTWYSTNHKAASILDAGKIGDLRKVVVRDGHQGPVEIGVNQEFLEWLTDPILNGGGAITDFGCYGANLITWLKKGERPISVSAITQQIKPDIYPNVDDEATILLEYEGSQGIIQASWNWPFNRKDMHIYGVNGYVYSDNRNDLRFRFSENSPELSEVLQEREYPYNDPFSYFAALINRDIQQSPYDLSSLENNMLVIEILDAAKRSAKEGRRIYLD